MLVKEVLDRALEARAGRLPNFLCAISAEDEEDKSLLPSVLQHSLGRYCELSSATSTSSTSLQTCKTFTVTVGKKVSSAQFYLNDVDDVTNLLQSFFQ